MQQYCVNVIGAVCTTVVAFPDATMSGNPGDCGNACSCEKSVSAFWRLTSSARPLSSPCTGECFYSIYVSRLLSLRFREDNADLEKRNALPCHPRAGTLSAGDRIVLPFGRSLPLDALAFQGHK